MTSWSHAMEHELIRQMSSPEFYGRPPDTEIRHVQTHISHVFLTGNFAYKVKKPVDFGFLDFSTLEKRRFYCEEELRLNRRFAPALYVAVTPIFQSGNRFGFGPPTPTAAPVEYALKMRQFDEGNLLTVWVEDGKLTEEHVRQIAQKMVRAHAAAHTDSHVASFGAPDAIERMIEDNFALVKRYVGRAIDAAQFDAIHASVLRAFRDNRALIEARMRARRIRECHGDLHLRNLCWLDNEFQFFDCIEFNEEYRCIDVMYELAFLAMDLEFRGRADLANVLINVYIEESGDYEGAVLLPAYMTVRAWVRAKVACISLDDAELSPEEHRHAETSARQHFDYAENRMKPRRPTLMLVCGLSGTGKSTVARELAKRLGAIHIRSDAVRKQLGSDVNSLYTREMDDATYARMTVLASALVRADWNVLLDATYRDAAYRAVAANVAMESNAEFRIVHLAAPPQVLRERIAHRSGDLSDATPELVEKQSAQFAPFDTEEKSCLISLDTTQPIDFESLAGRFK